MGNEAVLSKVEKRHLREQKELLRLQKQKNKPKFVGYLFFFLFVITIVYLTDEISTNIGKFLELDVTMYFFGSEEAANASSVRAIVNTVISIIAGVSMLLRPLADRFGRKLFLSIYTLGMGVAMAIIGITNGVAGWVVGTLLIQMCIPHDMQQVYIQECAPKEKRGRYFFAIKGIATLGLMIVPLLRLILNGVENNFKVIYIIVGVFGVTAAILSALLMRESDVYIDYRIHYLSLSDEERAALKAEHKEESKKGGIISGLIYMFKHKQLRCLLFSMMLIMFTYVMTDNYNTIMGVGYLQANNIDVVSSNYSLATAFTNSAVLTYPVGCGILVLLPALISDKIGRKKSSLIFGASALTLYVLFYIGSINAWSPYILGLLIGASCGAIWSAGDLILLMVTESSKTNMRVSSNAVALMAAGFCYFMGQLIVGAIGTALGDKYLAIVTIVAVVLGLVGGIILMSITVKETKGMDLNNVSASDFEENK